MCTSNRTWIQYSIFVSSELRHDTVCIRDFDKLNLIWRIRTNMYPFKSVQKWPKNKPKSLAFSVVTFVSVKVCKQIHACTVLEVWSIKFWPKHVYWRCKFKYRVVILSKYDSIIISIQTALKVTILAHCVWIIIA